MTSAYPYASYYGPSAYVKKGETLGKNYFDNPTRDYHGGRAAQHHSGVCATDCRNNLHSDME